MFERHFLVCTNCRADETGLQSCGAQSGRSVLQALLRSRTEQRLVTQIYITETACLGPCPDAGATIVVYPENVWYTGVEVDDVPELVERHMKRGEVVERLRNRHWPG
jgi:(2Fe-2S) ferredoxin